MLILANTVVLPHNGYVLSHQKRTEISQLRKMIQVFVIVNMFNFHPRVLLETLLHVIQDNLIL